MTGRPLESMTGRELALAMLDAQALHERPLSLDDALLYVNAAWRCPAPGRCGCAAQRAGCASGAGAVSASTSAARRARRAGTGSTEDPRMPGAPRLPFAVAGALRVAAP